MRRENMPKTRLSFCQIVVILAPMPLLSMPTLIINAVKKL